MADARTEILRRVRAALADRPPVPDAWDGGAVAAAAGTPPDGDALVERFVERVRDYRAGVAVAVGDEAVRQAIAAAFSRHAVGTVALPDDFPERWRPAAQALHEVAAAPDPRCLASLEGVLTTCATAIAETGTIVLDGGAGQGPRAMALLPDVHVCVVEASQVVPTIVAALAALRRTAACERRPLTLVSGPSATSDIELNRVEGVHGPRVLEVVVRAQPPHRLPV